jgi:hypothetical protein
MTDQLDIDFGDLPADMTEGFWQYHRDNPGVYRRLVAMARQLKAAGRHRIGIGMLFEVLRWEYWLADTSEPFKLNNNYRAYYSRLIEKREPDLVGMFTRRKSVSDEVLAA